MKRAKDVRNVRDALLEAGHPPEVVENALMVLENHEHYVTLLRFLNFNLAGSVCFMCHRRPNEAHRTGCAVPAAFDQLWRETIGTPPASVSANGPGGGGETTGEGDSGSPDDEA